MKNISTKIKILSLPLFFSISEISANNAFLSHSAGAENGITAGAGASNATGALDIAINPSLLTDKGTNIVVGGTWIRADVKATPKGPIANESVGTMKSKMKNFYNFSSGASYKINEKVAAGIALYGTGGIGTDYPDPRIKESNLGGRYDSKAVYELLNVSPTVAFKPNEFVSFGASFVYAHATFKSNSAVPGGAGFKETDGKLRKDGANGHGFKFGINIKPNDIFSIGASFSTKTSFGKFKKYEDMLKTSFDTPKMWLIGTKINITPKTKILLDVKRVYLSGVKVLGSDPLDGFGWNNMTVYMAGIRHDFGKFDLGLGYNYSKSAIPNKNIFANFLAPVNMEHHFTAGGVYRLPGGYELISSVFYVPASKQTDNGADSVIGKNGKGTRLSVSIMGIQVALKVKF